MTLVLFLFLFLYLSLYCFCFVFSFLGCLCQARLELAVERLKKAEGSGTSGRDWIVKEFARVVKEASALEAEGLRREESISEVHRTVSYRTITYQ